MGGAAMDSIEMNPFSILAFAARRCWEEYISVIVLSALWLLAQVLILPGPPMTAALFAMARATSGHEYWGGPDVWSAFKAHFWAAWRWALPNILIVGIALYNLSVFWNIPGAAWAVMRVVWLVVLLIVLSLNLFYWPFFLAANNKSMRNNYANCARFWLLHPGTAAVLFLVAVVAGVMAVSWILPIILGIVFWMALVTQTAVSRSLARA